MQIKGRQCLLCTCHGTQPIDAAVISRAVGGDGDARAVDQLCRKDVGTFEKAVAKGGPIMVACEQQAPLFEALAPEADLRFVDIRDGAGWSSEAAAATPKMAALLAAVAIDLPPSPALAMSSRGRCLVHGAGQVALDIALQLAGRLDVTLLLAPGGEVLLPARRELALLGGRIARAEGHLGAFRVRLDKAAAVAPWSRDAIAAEVTPQELETDLILDMSGGSPLFTAPGKRDGYRHVDPGDPAALQRAAFDLADMVGDFEKPRYIAYKAELCAHSRSSKTGCTRCLEQCPTGAITPAGDHVAIDPYVCAGCGSCAALCPTGAATYDAPEPGAIMRRLRELLVVHARAGGVRPVVLLHEARHGAPLIAALARYGDGLPANVLPLGVGEIGQLGLDVLLATLAFGAERVLLLASPAKAGDLVAVDIGIGYAEAIVAGLGYGAGRLKLVMEDDPDRLAAALVEPLPEPAMPQARFLVQGGKRDRLRLALDHLHAKAPEPVEAIALPEKAPFGTLQIDVEGCTLCLACVGACPTGALLDNPDKPTLRFLEDACIQCGLCAATCPEKVIALEPRISFAAEAKSPRTIKEEEPAECVRCGKAFGTRSSVERIVLALASKHSMFQSAEQIERIRMCDDCRIKAQFEAKDNPFASAERPRTRTTDDYLAERAAEEAKKSKS